MPEENKMNQILKAEEIVDKKVIISSTGPGEQGPDNLRWNNVFTSGSTFENGIGFNTPIVQEESRQDNQKAVSAFVAGDFN